MTAVQHVSGTIQAIRATVARFPASFRFLKYQLETTLNPAIFGVQRCDGPVVKDLHAMNLRPVRECRQFPDARYAREQKIASAPTLLRVLDYMTSATIEDVRKRTPGDAWLEP